jgi:hypothetical protein
MIGKMRHSELIASENALCVIEKHGKNATHVRHVIVIIKTEDRS